jgi:halimadienyl-diphosphate synthase
VNVRALDAIQYASNHPKFEGWADKIVALLRHSDLKGNLWFDKWHVSPYYLTAITILSALGFADELLVSRVKWILKTQHRDGGWGYYRQSTAEETAYVLLALFHWDEHVERIDPEIIHNGAGYLLEHINDRQYPELWIGKSLYTPRFLVEAVMLSALNQYTRYCV